jgi:NRAMP (natural resistance-associated macrophage protein)-like metal ion transporter
MAHHKVDHRRKTAPDHPAPKADVSKPLGLHGFLKTLGPGLVTGASDDDPSGIGTYSQAGAQLGYGIGWTMLFTFPLMAAIQEISARVGRVTGRGIAANVCQHYPAWMVNLIVALLFIANTINIGADLAAMGDALKLLVGGPAFLYVLVFGVASVAAQIFLDYKRYSAVLKWLTLSLFSYVAALTVTKVAWSDALRGIAIPHIQWTSTFLTTLVAIFGTTISPYLFFWQASQEAEDERIDARKKPLIEKSYGALKEFHRIRADTMTGMAFSNLIAVSIIITAAAALNAAGKTDIETSAQAAEALKPIAGNFAEFIFALGIIGTGLLAVPVLAGSAAYAIGEGRKWPVGLARKPREATSFYTVLALSGGIGVLVNVTPISPISALYWSAVINGILAVPVMILLMFLTRRRDVMSKFVISGPLYWLGWLSTAAMAACVAAMIASLFF